MKSIRERLLLAFLAVVAVLVVLGLAFIAVQVRVTEQYKSVSDTMIAEYRLVDTSSALIDAFNTRVKSAGTNSAESATKIKAAESQIQELTLLLDNKIIDTESKSNYLGFKASIGTLQHQVDASIARFEKGSIKDYVADYDKANQDYGFVRDNGTALIFSQLKYTSSIRDAINRQYLMSLYIGIGILALFILGCALFVHRFANNLSKPLQTLTSAAKQITDGNMDFMINEEVLKQTSEIGTLANAFVSMKKALKDKITQLDALNTESKKNAEVAINKNSELERLNKLMIDRELKMVELKKEIGEIKAQHGNTTT